jgi:hypothetical protein
MPGNNPSSVAEIEALLIVPMPRSITNGSKPVASAASKSQSFRWILPAIVPWVQYLVAILWITAANQKKNLLGSFISLVLRTEKIEVIRSQISSPLNQSSVLRPNISPYDLPLTLVLSSCIPLYVKDISCIELSEEYWPRIFFSRDREVNSSTRNLSKTLKDNAICLSTVKIGL